ncbi:hypothetical protein QBC47DRAFT_399266 [Echria macrotheca]|uniref:Zn(2)-C6 fungal-type domain-containing protein n=1 Tax=Echria macrotheca TaxID=438768 RepID=A0AAJ0FE48_9PEZI|nr:hypothetical protein QBC47DRAFT_399266 [Echria macrotheca]
MAENRRDGKAYPPLKDPGKKYPPEEESDDERSRPPPPNTMRLPSLQQYAPAENGYPHGQRYPDARYPQYPGEREYATAPRYPQAQAPRYPQDSERYPHDQQRYPPESHSLPRAPVPDQRLHSSDQRSWASDSPTNPNGYPPPPPENGRYLPPVQPGAEPPRMDEQQRLMEEDQQRRFYAGGSRYDDRRPYDDRGPYDERSRFAESRPPYDAPGYDQYYSRQPAMPAQQVRGASYPADYYAYRAQPYPYGDYARGAPGGVAPAPPPPQQQAAPRQRTSIACRYCRKRKIRCSGYANTTNGKCTNCDKLRIECVFQPVSSNSTTAFVPISAVPGGVPPGTPLYGSYGQPLPLDQQQQQLQQQQQSHQHARQQPQAPQPHRAYPPPASEYHSSLHSPTSQQSYDGETRRRRTRPSDDDEDHAVRLPPPTYPPDDNPRRRSPAERDSNGTSPNGYHQYPQQGFDDRTPTPQRNSPGEQLPTRGPPQSQVPSQTPPTAASASGNPMSLDHLIGPDPRPNGPRPSDIDQNMLGRLNRRNGN